MREELLRIADELDAPIGNEPLAKLSEKLRAIAAKAGPAGEPVRWINDAGGLLRHDEYAILVAGGLAQGWRPLVYGDAAPPSQPVALPDGIVAAATRYAELRDSVGSCSDGCCVVRRPTGMHTNGGCRCPDDRFKARRMMWAGQQLYEAIAAAPAGEGVGDA